MNLVNEIPQDQLTIFKANVSTWLEIDSEIMKLQSALKELKKKKKEKESHVTSFMLTYNINDLNTKEGKIKCNSRNVKKPLNKHNIRENLCKVFTDLENVDKAMELILTNREIKTHVVLTKPKVKI